VGRDVLAERAEIDRAVEGRTLCDTFADTVERRGERDALRWREKDGTWHGLTWREYRERARDVALGLRTLGFSPGSFALIQARIVPEHSVADMGIVHARGVPVSLYNTLAPEQIAYIANHCEATIAFVEDAGFLENFLKIREEVPHLERIVLIRGAEEVSSDWIVPWDEVLDAGRAEHVRDPGLFEETWRQVSPEDLLTLIYTSGTTGPPKAVMDTHRNVLWHWEAIDRVYRFDRDQTVISYLPLAHAAGRTTGQWNPAILGGTVVCCPDIAQLAATLAEVRPNLFVGVPRVYEKLYAGMNAALAAQDESVRRAVSKAIDVGREVVAHAQKGAEAPAALRAEHEAITPVLKAVLAKVGLENCRLALVGAAPIATEVIEFFMALGITLSEVWGMSELTAVATANPPERIRIGTVGPAVPGVEVRLAPDGELLARGGNRMSGYYRDPEKTAEAIDAEGWMHTGDVGEVDEDGYFRVVDRKKELIITAGGKNISPANLENALKHHALIGQACVIGDRRAYLTALIVLDPEVAPAWARSQGIAATSVAELALHPDVEAEVRRIVDEVNSHVSRVENVRKFSILADEWTAESEELTPTLKLKRRVINEKYADAIEEMYV
jgi:long-chain acyl-CoA synthetase